MELLDPADNPVAETETEPNQSSKNYLVFSRKWRPQTFGDVVGQSHVSNSLLNAIQNNRISHAYLFTGPRGVGKTSMARIFSKALNCVETDSPNPNPCGVCEQCKSISSGSNMDIIEIDGASNNRVDEIRELREAVGYTPFAGRYKVYIIDEVHMLSIGAFNALLKTLEEPPARVVFILATTELHKIPATIVSRCQKFEFQSISKADIIQRLDFICEQEKADIAEGQKLSILETIAHSAEGGMRDAQVVMDQAITLSDGPLTLETVQDLLGLVDYSVCEKIILGIRESQVEQLLEIVGLLIKKGSDLSRVTKQLMRFTRDLLVLLHSNPGSANSELIQCPQDQMEVMKNLVNQVSAPFLLNLSHRFVELDAKMKGTAPQQFLMELALIELAVASKDLNVSKLLSEVQNLKQMVKTDPNLQQPEPSKNVLQDKGPALNIEKPREEIATSQLSVSQPEKVWEALIQELQSANPVTAQKLSSLTLSSLNEKSLEVNIPESEKAVAIRESVFNDSQIMELMHNILKKITGKTISITARIESSKPVSAPEKSNYSAKDKKEFKRQYKNMQYVETMTEPDQCVKRLFNEEPEFRKYLTKIFENFGGGQVVRIDGVHLQNPIEL